MKVKVKVTKPEIIYFFETKQCPKRPKLEITRAHLKARVPIWDTLIEYRKIGEQSKGKRYGPRK